MNVTNPKVSLFFLAFLPQFVDPERSDINWQLSALGGTFILMAFTIFTCLAGVTSHLEKRLKPVPHLKPALNRLAGVVFSILAAQLLLSELDLE